jgi:hypothetical protein
MARLRRILGPIAATWLACHGAGLTVAPIVLSVTAPAGAVECTCTHGDHAICPMHHRPASDSRCAIQAAHDGDTTVLSSLLSGVGIIGRSPALTVVPRNPTVPRFDFTAAPFRAAPPDPPPPRA